MHFLAIVFAVFVCFLSLFSSLKFFRSGFMQVFLNWLIIFVHSFISSFLPFFIISQHSSDICSMLLISSICSVSL